MTQTTCKNCTNEFEGNYCNLCGQSAKVKRFSFGYFLHETFFSSLDIEEGFFSTLLILFKHPGKGIRDYIEGKRVSLYVPGKFLLLFGAIATFLAVRYQLFTNEQMENNIAGFSAYLQSFFNYAEENTTVINLISIPAFALSSYFVFYRQRFNYTEHLVLNIYITAMQLVMLILLFPLLEWVPSWHQESVLVYTILTFAYNIWVYLSFFRAGHFRGLLLVLLAMVLAYIGQFILNLFIYSALVRFGVLSPADYVAPEFQMYIEQFF